MMCSTKGVVLHRINYKESSVIATIFTRDFGRQTYIVNGVRKAKSRTSLQLFEPATLLDMEVYASNKPGLQRAKELSLMYPEQGLRSDFYRQAIRMFCAEVVYKSTSDEDTNLELYSFLESAFLTLEQDDDLVADFAAKFIVHLCRQQGFWPENNWSTIRTAFNLKEGSFERASAVDINQMPLDHSKYLSAILGTNFAGKLPASASGKQRGQFLEEMLKYYDRHLDKQLNIRSLEVIQSTLSY